MGRYLVELYLTRTAAGDVDAATARARSAAAELDERVCCLRSIFVPEDETWLLLYDAPTAAAVRCAVDRAGLARARVTEAVTPRSDISEREAKDERGGSSQSGGQRGRLRHLPRCRHSSSADARLERLRDHRRALRRK